MHLLSSTARYIFYLGYTDMRKGFDSLSGLVISNMQSNPLYEDTVVKYEDTAVKFEDLQVKYEALQQEVAHLKKMIFGSKHERFIPTENNPAQLTLNVQADQIAQCNIIDAKKISYTKITS